MSHYNTYIMTVLLHRLTKLAVVSMFFAFTGCNSETEDHSVTTTPVSIANPSWEIQYTDSTARFIGLFPVDSKTVWASGANGKFVRTTDGGESWISGTVEGADSLEFRDIHAFDNRTAYILSIGNATDSRIYRTDDGGETWNLSFQNQDPNSFFDCFSFWNRERGIAFSDSHEGKFRLIRTMNGGTTWEDIPADAVPDAREGEGAFASSGTCVVTRPGGLGWFSTGASGVDTRVIRTADYGETWSEAPTPIESGSSSAGIFSLSFLDNENGIAVGGDFGKPDSLFLNTATTSDGGETWTAAGMSNIRGSIYGATYVPGTPSPTVIAVAPTGSDLSTDNGRSWNLFSSQDFWAVAATSPEDVWAVGPNHIARLRTDARNK